MAQTTDRKNTLLTGPPCPACRSTRTVPGPAYDRALTTCWDCGRRFVARHDEAA